MKKVFLMIVRLFTGRKQDTLESIQEQAHNVQKRMIEIEESTNVGYHYLMARHPEYRELDNKLEELMARLRIYQ